MGHPIENGHMPRHMDAGELARFRRPSRVRGWRRLVPRSRAGRLAAIVAALVGLGGIAVALFFLTIGTTGQVTRASYEVTLATASTQSGTCVVTRAGGNNPSAFGQMDIQWTGVVSGDECTALGNFHGSATNQSDMRLQSFDAPDGIEVDLNGSCGATVAPSLTTVPVAVTLSLEDGYDDVALDPLLGFNWVRASDYDPLLCD